MTLEKVFISILDLLPPTKSSDADYCIIREVVKQPLFNQRELPVMLSAQAPNISEEYILSYGLVRLLVEVDAVIHSFLKTHLCKNSRQVETLIRNTVAMKPPVTSKQAVNPPPVLVLPSLLTPLAIPAAHIADENEPVTPDLKSSSSSISCTPTLHSITEGDGDDSIFADMDSSMNGDNSNNNNRFSHIHPLGTATDGGYASGNRSLSSLPDASASNKSSNVSIPPFGGYGATNTPRSRSAFTSQTSQGSTSSLGREMDEDFQDMNPLIYGVGIETPRVWSTRITQLDDYFASSYGNNYYIDMKYDPSFTVEFLIGPSPNSLNNSMAILQGKQTVISVSITNNTTNFVGFAIRCFDLNSPHNPHIVYPLMGLEVLEPSSVPWVRNADIPINGAKQSKYLVMEMFVCRTEMNAVWNVQRRYIISVAEDNHAYVV